MYLLYSYCIAKHLAVYWGGICVMVRDRFGGMGRFKGGLSCKGRVNSEIMIVKTEMN